MSAQGLGFWEGILDVASGRGKLRLFVQPLMAIALGVRLGIADAKEGKAPFLLRLFDTSGPRAQFVRQAALDVIVPFSLAIAVDGILQYLAHGYVRPLAAVIVGIVLIGLPFALSRAIANRVWRRADRGHRAKPGAHGGA